MAALCFGSPRFAGSADTTSRETRTASLRDRANTEKAKIAERQTELAGKKAAEDKGKPVASAKAAEGQPGRGNGRPPSPVRIGKTSVLTMTPFFQTALVGERFATEVSYYTDGSHAVDRLEIRISYPAALVRPLQVFDYPIRSALDAKGIVQEASPGLLTYSASFAKPVKTSGNRPVLTVAWQALAETESAEIRLDVREGKTSSVYREERDLLASPRLLGNSCVNAVICVRAPKRRSTPGLRVREQASPNAFLLGATGEDAGVVKISLGLPETSPREGDEFVIDVLVDNSAHAIFDEVALAIGFDRDRVEVLDWDRNGWIRSGVNILDGHAHLDFPFNVYIRNEVDNLRGRINYRMASRRLHLLPSGSVARIRCRALADGAAESFTVDPPRQSKEWFTDIRALGQSLLPDEAAAPEVVAALPDER